jgi:hypothetical protein
MSSSSIDRIRWLHRVREWETRMQSLRIVHVQKSTPLNQLTKGLLRVLTRGTMLDTPPHIHQSPSPLLKYRSKHVGHPENPKLLAKRFKCDHKYVRDAQSEMDKKWHSVNVTCSRCKLRGWLDLNTKRVHHWAHWLHE